MEDMLLANTSTSSLAHTLESHDYAILLFKGFCFLIIILTALFGNCLVLIAVARFERLRQVRTNIFLVSLALADFLVALLVMPFNASMSIMKGRWLYGRWFCDIFNANDVLFSTASILHLCCISTERYIAVISPLTYERKMTRTRIGLMLSVTWILSILISYVPILTGIYTHPTSLDGGQTDDADICEFIVNPYYAIISSGTSFWMPCFVMVGVYIRIFVEARSQEKKIHRLTLAPAGKHYCSQHSSNGSQVLENDASVPGQSSAQNQNDNLLKPTRPGGHLSRYNSAIRLDADPHNVETTDQMKIRRENKAAKTLGIIMGAFLVCWCPFFLWYTTTNICGDKCPYPPILMEILFWIGYTNSTLNPIIYAFYNRSFRRSFKLILCCSDRRSHMNDPSKSPYFRRSNAASPPLPTLETRASDLM